MKIVLCSTFFLLMLALTSFGQSPEPAVDSLKNIKYLYKDQPMPFDSGVAMSEKQYMYFFKQNMYSGLKTGMDQALTPVPKVVYITTEVKKKKKGGGFWWFLLGTLPGAAGGYFLSKQL